MNENPIQGFYNRSQIESAIISNQILCVPFKPANLNKFSLNVTLGNYFYRVSNSFASPIFNPLDVSHIESYFDGPYKAISHSELSQLESIQPLVSIKLDHPVIEIKPGERILAHIHEFIGMKLTGLMQIKTRSSWAKNGLLVCPSSGFIESGSVSRLTLQIYNLNPKQSLVLPVGLSLAQIFFCATTPEVSELDIKSDNFIPGKDIDTIIKNWSPDSMLPKTYKESYDLPIKIDGLSYA